MASTWLRHEQMLANLTIDSEQRRMYDETLLRNLNADTQFTSAATMPIHVNGRVLGDCSHASGDTHWKRIEN